MSSSDFSDNEDVPGPSFEVVYPVGEETEVPHTKGQLFKTVLVEGTGSKPANHSKVTVSYKGTLASDGSVFDSSDTFDFTIGMGQVIKGWDQGVATMRIGERAILRCLPEYAYGVRGSPPTIPANATLNFEVELKEWSKSVDVSLEKNKSIMKDIVEEGRNWATPDYETEARLDITIASEDSTTTLWSKDDWSIVVGDALLPSGLEAALLSMKEGERALVRVRGDRVIAAPDFGIQASGASITYRVYLKAFTKVDVASFKGADKTAQGLRRKDAGNEYFKTQNWVASEKKYRRALEFLENDYELNEEEKADATKVAVIVHSNLAQVYINMKRFTDATSQCNAALTKDASNVKALFRRAKALRAQDEWKDAIADLTMLLELDPNNADAAQELASVKAQVRAFEQKEKSKYAGLFSKLSSMEEKDHAKS
jgi:FKBP-type peptidyl-prolyl cis-trans isomerase 2